MIKNFRPQARRISLLGLITVILLAGVVLTNAKQPASISSSATVMDLDEPADTFTQVFDDSLDPDINWVSENEGGQSGNLDAAIISIGDVHLGDTKQKVWSILGEPDEVVKEPTSREDIWQYNKYLAKIYFYKNSPDYPAEGVVRIQIDSPSQWKTESGIGIGDTLQQIKSRYSNLNGKLESASNKTVWVNGENIASVSQMYYPTLKFKLHDDKIQQIELSNQNQNPGPYHKKPLSYADMTIGDIQIGASSEEIKSRLGDPSQKDDTMTGPEWTFHSQGIVLGIDPVWLIRVSAPFKGSTPRGIHIGSTKEDVINAYPDAFIDRNSHDWLVQNSTDGTLQIIFEFDNNVVTKITLTRDLVLNHL
jgi:hypothetical protein